MNTTEPFVNAVNFDPVELVRKHPLAGLCDDNLLFIEFRPGCAKAWQHKLAMGNAQQWALALGHSRQIEPEQTVSHEAAFFKCLGGGENLSRFTVSVLHGFENRFLRSIHSIL